MFLIALIILLFILSVSQLKMIMKRKTGNNSWGEPVVTVIQILLMICLVIALAMDMAM